MRGLIRQSLRILQLPVQVNSEALAARALSRFLRLRSIRYEDSLTWTRLELNLWKDNGTASDHFRHAVRAILAADPTNAASLTTKYFELHEQLRSEHGLNHDESTAFLSHLNLAVTLAYEHRFTGARLTQVLSEVDTRVRFSRQSVSQALSALGFGSSITGDQIDEAYERDGSFEGVFFADADHISSARIAGEAAADLGFNGDLEQLLLTLGCAAEPVRYVPYIQMLHFQCMILEYFDHSVLDLYEFSPRGRRAENLFAHYPGNLVSAGNPFLNNAKSVGTMDGSWVESKKPSDRLGARALFALLSAIDAMSYAARRELALIVRSWVMRFLRLSGDVATPLPELFTVQQAQQLVANIREGNTRTLGILEQRCLDALAVFNILLSIGGLGIGQLSQCNKHQRAEAWGL